MGAVIGFSYDERARHPILGLVPRFAAIDVGSNASRLMIVQAKSHDRVKVFRTSRAPVRLGHSVFQTGELDDETVNYSVETLRAFAGMMEDANVDGYRAVVTASVRGARNGGDLIERARREAGITLDAIDGVEEARLVALAMQSRMNFVGRSLLLDLGGGSLELTELNEERIAHSVSLPIGTVRLLEAYLERGAAVSEEGEHLVVEHIERVLAPHRRRVARPGWSQLVGSGGNLEAIARFCPAKAGRNAAIDVPAAVELQKELAAIPPAERMARYEMKPDRADVIVPALYVVTMLAEMAGVDRITVPGVGLKEGIVDEQVQRHYRLWDVALERDKLLTAAVGLGRRYHFDERHGTQVAGFAMDLFDATRDVHGLGDEEGTLLMMAALLHDVGDFVAPGSHHKHSQYIIDNSEIMGVSREDRHLVALIARYHRRSHPDVRHSDFKALGERQQEIVRKLAGVLRIADALDRSHVSKVEGFDVQVKREKVALTVHARDDISLELWTVERKADLFEEALGRKLIATQAR